MRFALKLRAKAGIRGFKPVLLVTLGALTASCAIDQDTSESVESSDDHITIDTNATYTIVGVGSNKCVGITGASTANLATVEIATCSGATSQQFRAESMGGGFFRLKNVNSGLCLDVTGASMVDGAAVIQWACSTGTNQQWSFTDVATGVERITARHSGKVLDVTGQSTANGAKLEQWTSNNQTNQQWKLASGSVPTGKFVGNITTSGQIEASFLNYWNQITPENEGKWGSVEGTRNQMNWASLDKIHDYAKQHNIKFKEHNFVWGAQQPGWLNNLSQAEQKAEVEQWIQLFCQRYPDVDLIDVVNEPPPHTTPVYMNALGGAGASGYDWIVQVFKWAHQYCPNATLILNDYNNIEYANDNNHTIDIVNKIKAAGAPIHAVGAQAHGAFQIPTSTVKGFIDNITAQTGLPVYITEYDINIADDNQQKNVMQDQFTMFWGDSNVKGITLWGYVYGATWLPNTGLIKNGQPRPAMTWLMGFLGK